MWVPMRRSSAQPHPMSCRSRELCLLVVQLAWDHPAFLFVTVFDKAHSMSVATQLCDLRGVHSGQMDGTCSSGLVCCRPCSSHRLPAPGSSYTSGKVSSAQGIKRQNAPTRWHVPDMHHRRVGPQPAWPAGAGSRACGRASVHGSRPHRSSAPCRNRRSGAGREWRCEG